MFGLFANPYKKYSDQELCEAMFRKDILAYEEIYDRYTVKVFHYLVNFLIDKQSAKDVLSNCFIKIYSYLQTTQGNNLKGLIYRIAHNEMVNYIKSNRYYEREDDQRDTIQSNDKPYLEDLEFNFKKEKLLIAMESLDLRTREIMYLYYFEDWDYSDIATMLETNINTVGVWIMRGREKLKANILN